jgi:hypothetical protein
LSSDNGIYIIEFPEGFRVAYASAIENIDYYPEGSQERKAELKSYFGESPVYKTYQEAFKAAQNMYQDIDNDPDVCYVLEYGIVNYGKYESFIEPKPTTNCRRKNLDFGW